MYKTKSKLKRDKNNLLQGQYTKRQIVLDVSDCEFIAWILSI